MRKENNSYVQTVYVKWKMTKLLYVSQNQVSKILKYAGTMAFCEHGADTKGKKNRE